jgi:hypothetical protein
MTVRKEVHQMLTSPSLDEIQRDIQDRLDWAQHEALIRSATRSSPVAGLRLLPIRNRAASALRDLACRLDPAVCLEGA